MALREQGATLEEAVEATGDDRDDGDVDDEKMHIMEKLALDDSLTNKTIAEIRMPSHAVLRRV